MRFISCCGEDVEEKKFLKIINLDQERLQKIKEMQKRDEPNENNNLIEKELSFKEIASLLREPFHPNAKKETIPDSLVELYYKDYLLFYYNNIRAESIRDRCIDSYRIVLNFYGLIQYVEKLYIKSLMAPCNVPAFANQYIFFIKDYLFIKKSLFNNKTQRILHTCHNSIDEGYNVNKEPVEYAISEIKHYIELLTALGIEAKKWAI
ncbi:MAG: hypothetical protein ACMUIP_10730 [bacterium]